MKNIVTKKRARYSKSIQLKPENYTKQNCSWIWVSLCKVTTPSLCPRNLANKIFHLSSDHNSLWQIFVNNHFSRKLVKKYTQWYQLRGNTTFPTNFPQRCVEKVEKTLTISECSENHHRILLVVQPNKTNEWVNQIFFSHLKVVSFYSCPHRSVIVAVKPRRNSWTHTAS